MGRMENTVKAETFRPCRFKSDIYHTIKTMHYVSSKKKENESAIYAYTIVPSLFALFIVCGIAVIIVPYCKGK